MIADGVQVTVVPSSATTTINNAARSNPPSKPAAMGSFTNGDTAFGTPLPSVNGGPTATYAGGIGIASGVCLCTGSVSDSLQTASAGLGFGVEGPNNGDGEGILIVEESPVNHTGEITTQLFVNGEGSPDPFVDQDFEDLAFPAEDPGGGDPTVLEFQVQLEFPGYLRVSFVFASDEYPFYVNPAFPFNDSVAIIVDEENIATITMNSIRSPFDLFDISDCALFQKNNTAPAPAVLTTGFNPPNVHAIPSASRYDHEFGGFTKILTRETCDVLAPGTHTVKIVVQDVADQRVDAAVFIPAGSLKSYRFLPADFNLDGKVDGIDFSILSANWMQCGKKFTEGDANGDGCVNVADFSILSASFGQTGGNRNLKYDFDRDGFVTGTDDLIWQRGLGLTHCASRFEGDADGDGDVDGADLPPGGAGSIIADPCGTGGGQFMASGGGSEELSSSGEAISTDAADVDNDGDVDYDDVQLFGKAMPTE